MIEIDGSAGEGGGQILRTSLSLSLLTGRPFKLLNIRANRTRPGLQPQHLMCVKAAGAICGAHYKGAEVGSSTLYFEPGPVKAGNYTFTIGTAGATALVLHTVYLPLALRGTEPSTVAIVGGTHNPFAPCHHFNAITWGGYLAKLGITIEQEMIRPGFYPRGGGEIRAVIHPCERVTPLTLVECPDLTTAGGFAAVASLPATIAKRVAQRLATKLKQEKIESHIPIEEWEGSLGAGCVAAVIFRQAPVPTLFFGLGERGKSAESVAGDALEEALRYREAKAPVDPHSADQLLLPLAFAPGRSEYRASQISRHLTTNVDTVKLFVDRTIRLDDDRRVVVE